MAFERERATQQSDGPLAPNSTSDQSSYTDLGFGTSIGRENRRLINKDGSLNVVRTGQGINDFHGYVYLVTVPWWKFFLAIMVSYTLANILFAVAYLAIGIDQISGGESYESFFDQFTHAFYFSVQTFTTVGFGQLSPEGHGASLLASLEAMIGLLSFAVATGVLWGRFSRPSARIGFSKHAIIAPYRLSSTGKQVNSFQFRIVNRRRNQLIDLSVQVTVMFYKVVNGEQKQVYHRLELERKSVSLFPLNWTIVHPITHESPLYGLLDKDLKELHAEFLIVINAFDDTFSQPVHVRTSYRYDEIFWGARFVRIFHEEEEGPIRLEIDKVGVCERAEVVPYPYPEASGGNIDVPSTSQS